MDATDKETKAKAEVMHPTFPLARFCYWGYYRAYYPFGNTPAEDFLENSTNILHPSILLLGCGDLRSCFHTLWKNFDSQISAAPKKFDGVSFTVNDCSAAIGARNILFLHMCLHLPEESMDRKKWLSAMWAIWYCHELYPHHLDILDTSLKTLISFSYSIEVWSKKDNPLHSLVCFTSSSSLSEVSNMWNLWLHKAMNVTSKKKMHESRNQLLIEMIKDRSEHSLNLSNGHTLIYGDMEQVSKLKAAGRAPEVRSYLDIGSCYAEDVVGLNLGKTQTKINLTMYEKPDGTYTCHYGLVPFECYYHTVEFSPQYFKSRKIGMPCDVIVPTESFKSNPFLANSVQQFVMWVQSSNRAFKNIKISFNFDIQDAITLCQQLAQLNMCCTKTGMSKYEYDVINTSNLMDHLSASNLILACFPLLKADGVITTTSMCCRSCTNTGEELLSLLFGFSSELFPVILGVRCISHEGGKYSNPVTIKPSPPDISHFLKCLPHVRTFIWVKESNVQALIFEKLPQIQDGSITEAFVNIFGSCAFSLLNHGPGESKNMLSRNSIETALSMLKRFISLSGESTSAFSYWEPLCAALKIFAGPFLHCLQTQFLLHEVHAHLTLSEEDCPICQKTALSNKLGLFCANIELDYLNYGTPFFMAFIHQCSSMDSEFLQKEAINGGDVHIFDCFDYACSQKHLKLKFFAPLTFVQKKYKVSIAFVHRTNTDNLLATMVSLQLQDIRLPWTKYAFYQTEQIFKSGSSSPFGTVTLHTCDGGKSETEISLSHLTLDALSSSEIETSKISCREVKLQCGSLNFHLRLSYPINYKSVKMELSKSKGSLSVSCQRQIYSLADERPCFIVSPDHKLSIPPSKPDPSHITKHAYMQVTREEAKFVQTPHTAHLCSVDTKVRGFLQFFFESVIKSSYFCIQSQDDSNCCLIIVNEVLFDYKNKTPAIDLAYCFVDDFDALSVMSQWNEIISSSVVQNMLLEAAGLEILKKALKYFSRRTNGTLESAGNSSKLSQLIKSNLDFAFTRAVLYLLLCDPDVKLYAVGDFFGFTTTNHMPKVGGTSCGCCRKLTFTAKKCGRCEKISYCSKTCQTSHWSMHKRQCSSVSRYRQSKCTFCEISLDTSENKVKKPSCACADIQYCSNNCKKRDKPKHCKICGKNTQKGSKSQKPSSISVAKLPKCELCDTELLWSEKCSECDNADYCNLSCQRKHWPSHKLVCKGKLKNEDPEVAEARCSFCKKSTSCLSKCTKCSRVLYCNQTCQRKDWPEHQKACFEYQAIGKAEALLSTHNICNFCNKSSRNMRKCTRCEQVQYCDRACQSNDWPRHKTTCIRASEIQECEAPEEIWLRCSCCKKRSNDLKKCTKCGTVQYCNRYCQAKDWPIHKNNCTNAAKVQASSKYTSSIPLHKCSYCRKSIQDIMKCSHCDLEQYCSLSCRQKHWPEHQVFCIFVTKTKQEPSLSCFSCGSTSKMLLTCKKCGRVKYCGRECQADHWKIHKLDCTTKM